MRGAVLGWSAALAQLLGLVAVSAEAHNPVDPTLPARRVVGTSPGSARPSRGEMLLPVHPRLLWRTRVEGGIEHGLAVDSGGTVVVASSESLSELGRNGRVAWSIRLGARATGAPVLLSDGTRVVVTADGQLVAANRQGELAWIRRIPCPAKLSATILLPWTDGGLVLAAAEQLFWMDGGGSWRASSSVPSRITGLLKHVAAPVVVTLTGEVFAWDGVGAPRRLATLGGRSDQGAVLVGEHLLAAVVDEKRLVEIDLVTTARRVRVPEGPLSYQSPVVATPRGETRLVSTDGLLLGHDAEGRETLRVALAPAASGRDAGAPLAARPGSALLLVDGRGTVAFARSGQEPGVLTADKEVFTPAAAACGDPVALVSAGPGRLAGACRSGVVWLAAD
jgi:hypothetical protein